MGATGDRDPLVALDHEHRLRFLTDNVPTIMLYQLVIDPQGRRRFTYLSGDREAHFGAKPYSVHDLSSRVREVLDQAARS